MRLEHIAFTTYNERISLFHNSNTLYYFHTWSGPFKSVKKIKIHLLQGCGCLRVRVGWSAWCSAVKLPLCPPLGSQTQLCSCRVEAIVVRTIFFLTQPWLILLIVRLICIPVVLCLFLCCEMRKLMINLLVSESCIYNYIFGCKLFYWFSSSEWIQLSQEESIRAHTALNLLFRLFRVCIHDNFFSLFRLRSASSLLFLEKKKKLTSSVFFHRTSSGGRLSWWCSLVDSIPIMMQTKAFIMLLQQFSSLAFAAPTWSSSESFAGIQLNTVGDHHDNTWVVLGLAVMTLYFQLKVAGGLGNLVIQDPWSLLPSAAA